MRSIVLSVFLFVSLPYGSAQESRFPYKARVVAPEAYVRSGGGEAFYPTQKLQKDAIVTVRRHDPAGWYMIDPPKKSFSWIPARYVTPGPNGAGSVTENNVVVFVGSEFGDDIHVWQRKLMAGETVQILDQRSVDTVSGPKQMFRIQPPKREFRWIPGKALVPVGDSERQRRDSNPFEVPSDMVEQRFQQPRRSVQAATPTVLSDGSRYSPNKGIVRLKTIREEQKALQVIDRKFREMILQDPSQWNLSEIEKEYQQLQQSATHKPLSGQIDLRYPAIRHYRQRKAEVDSFQKLISATDQRDNQLLAMQFGLPQAGLSLPENPQTGPIVEPTTALTIPGLTIPQADSVEIAQGNWKPEGIVQPSTSLPFAEIPDSVAQVAGPINAPASRRVPSNRFIGAGVLQKTVGPNGQQYVLTTPAGKILAHVAAQSPLVLDQHLGQAVGLRGQRWFDPQLNSDRIQVTGLESVRLTQ